MRIPQDESKLSVSFLNQVLSWLPEPDLHESMGDIQISLYKAKSLYKAEWSDPYIRRLVIEARKSYRSYYGDVDLTDKYDDKSAIYLVRLVYPVMLNKKSITITHWYSMRFVPADGSPLLSTDLEFYVYQIEDRKSSILELLKSKIHALQGVTEKKVLSQIITFSRICRISSYGIDPNGQFIDIDKDVLKKFSQNKSIPILAFLFMNVRFFSEKGSIPFTIITCQMSETTSHRILAYKSTHQTRLLPFIPAGEALHVLQNTIYIDRNKPGVYAYRYPGYFLNKHDLISTLKHLVKKQLLPEEIISAYLLDEKRLDTLDQTVKRRNLKKMGTLLSVRGRIHQSKISGEELRELCNKRVRDGSVLYIMNVSSWKKAVIDLIEFARKDQI